MTAINLEIEQDEIFTFRSLFDALSPLRKRIWKCILAYTLKYPHAIPRQKTIANDCGCSRSAISEAFRIFIDVGWLTLLSRGGHKSKILMIPPKYQSELLYKCKGKKIVRVVYEKATIRATPIIANRSNTVSSTGTGNLTSPAFQELIQIPPKINNLPLSFEDKLKLSMVPEWAYQETLYRVKKYHKSCHKIRDQGAYFVGTALNIFIKQGGKLPWGRFYKTLKLSA